MAWPGVSRGCSGASGELAELRRGGGVAWGRGSRAREREGGSVARGKLYRVGGGGSGEIGCRPASFGRRSGRGRKGGRRKEGRG